MRTRRTAVVRLLTAAGAALLAPILAAATSQSTDPRFEIVVSAAARQEPVPGRGHVAISRHADPPPHQQASPTGAPLFSRAIESLTPGTPIVVSAADRGYPIESLRQLPAGEYFVQPFVNVYTKFARADGHTVWLHMDQWEGQNWKTSPGNLYGDPIKIRFDPAASAPITLTVDKVIPPIAMPAETESVKRFRIQSQILTKWWGHPIFIGATVLLPKGYA